MMNIECLPISFIKIELIWSYFNVLNMLNYIFAGDSSPFICQQPVIFKGECTFSVVILTFKFVNVTATFFYWVFQILSFCYDCIKQPFHFKLEGDWINLRHILSIKRLLYRKLQAIKHSFLKLRVQKPIASPVFFFKR